jgi:hypothetical protein
LLQGRDRARFCTVRRASGHRPARLDSHRSQGG